MGEGGGGALKIKDQLGHVEETEGKGGGGGQELLRSLGRAGVQDKGH